MSGGGAIVVGSDGQDGRLLFDALAADGRDVVGLARGGTRRSGGGGRGPAVDLLDAAAVADLVAAEGPAEVYFLAAVHQSSQDATPGPGDLVRRSLAVNVAAPLNFLEAIRTRAPAARLFYAASCHVFGPDPPAVPQDERTPLDPRGAYAVTKAAGLHVCRLYREDHGVFAAGGILYNHESPYRGPAFVSQKIARAAARAGRGPTPPLVLGDLSARVDWGAAADTVDAMRRVLRVDRADDFVVATGEPHSVGEFAEVAFAAVGLDWRAHVTEDPSVLTRRPLRLVGNAGRLRAATGWVPATSFEQMVRSMVTAAAAAAAVAEASGE